MVCIGLIGVGFSWYVKGSGTSVDAKLGYIGNIIGGVMYMLSVVMTILFTIRMQKDADNKRERERKEEFSIRYRPILQITNKNAKLEQHAIGEA